jgi:osmotically-inducible protein OsmY
MKLTTDTARDTLLDARKQAREATQDARREARRRLIRARISAAKTQAKLQTKAQERTRGGRANVSGLGAKAAGAAGAVGLAAGYFLDPESGKKRRDEARDRALALVRRGADRTRREAEHVHHEKPAANDQALADRVKTEIFQPADAPKGSVNVNVERGVVYLRGEVERADEIRKLVERAGAVEGVSAVENLLHTP